MSVLPEPGISPPCSTSLERMPCEIFWSSICRHFTHPRVRPTAQGGTRRLGGSSLFLLALLSGSRNLGTAVILFLVLSPYTSPMESCRVMREACKIQLFGIHTACSLAIKGAKQYMVAVGQEECFVTRIEPENGDEHEAVPLSRVGKPIESWSVRVSQTNVHRV